MKKTPDLQNPIEALLQVAKDLRDPNGGCPWDLKQTHQSMAKHLVEETYEAIDAIYKLQEEDERTWGNLKEELGDVLFQVIFQAQLASEKNKFTFQDIAKYMTEKLIFRHPHVYGDLQGVDSAEQVLQNWEKLKRTEREKKGLEKSMLDSIPNSMPALLKALRMGQKVSRVHFDWQKEIHTKQDIEKKIQEELTEWLKLLPTNFTEEVSNVEKAEEELGDLLFAISQMARKYGLDPERALQKSNEKFRTRFRFMEKKFKDKLEKDELPSTEEWEAAWEEAKKEETKNRE
ncbi:MAG: nucleoside triphosphate pyrophosphohydrolase [Candidatus Hydrogenedentota bacterium]|nr:MAG: nucleoside triphosphate pyrophosphohydrolase [Candidatus Hydrogenedentota bacterium]